MTGFSKRLEIKKQGRSPAFSSACQPIKPTDRKTSQSIRRRQRFPRLYGFSLPRLRPRLLESTLLLPVSTASFTEAFRRLAVPSLFMAGTIHCDFRFVIRLCIGCMLVRHRPRSMKIFQFRLGNIAISIACSGLLEWFRVGAVSVD